MSNVQRPLLSASLAPGLCSILCSPSRDSFTTDLSVLSISSAIANLQSKPHHLSAQRHSTNSKHRLNKISRGSSPNPDVGRQSSGPFRITDAMWLEECNDLIRSCGQLSIVLGIQKSFSTSDITQIPPEKLLDVHGMRGSGLVNAHLRPAISELALNSLQRCGYMLDTRLTSRSCSTWVAVGELASTSQLPSPHGYTTALSVNQSVSQQQLSAGHIAGTTYSHGMHQQPPPFTAADFVRSVNKKVRENYIRTRLLTTYRAIERLSQSEFNLDQLATIASTTISTTQFVAPSPGPTQLIVPSICTVPTEELLASADAQETVRAADGEATVSAERPITPTSTAAPQNTSSTLPQKKTVSLICPNAKTNVGAGVSRNLTIHDIEKERGRPLSKYDRNMMIFNWLHSLDETSTAEEYE